MEKPPWHKWSKLYYESYYSAKLSLRSNNLRSTPPYKLKHLFDPPVIWDGRVPEKGSFNNYVTPCNWASVIAAQHRTGTVSMITERRLETKLNSFFFFLSVNQARMRARTHIHTTYACVQHTHKQTNKTQTTHRHKNTYIHNYNFWDNPRFSLQKRKILGHNHIITLVNSHFYTN